MTFPIDFALKSNAGSVSKNALRVNNRPPSV